MGGSLVETITGAGAIVVAILGLVGILPEALLAVSTIAIGSAFLMASGFIASRFNRLLTQMPRTTLETREMAIGMTIEFVGGVAGIALGVLSLVGLLPLILLPAAAIVYGFALLFGTGVQARLDDLEAQCNAANESVRRVVRETISAASGIRMVFGRCRYPGDRCSRGFSAHNARFGGHALGGGRHVLHAYGHFSENVGLCDVVRSTAVVGRNIR